MSNYKLNSLRLAGVLFSAGILCTACSQDDSSTAPSISNGPTKSIHGTSQKGPFVKGSKVTLYEMDENLNQTGAHNSTTIDNDLGNYAIKDITLEGPYAWLNANGYYTDELTGELSTRTISLNSLVDLNGEEQININILTHLSFDRVVYLVKKGMPVAEARKQAEKEVMKAFGFEEEETSFDQLDILHSSEGDAKLLAISLMMLIAGDGGLVADRMAKISFDLESDGIWDEETIKQDIQYDIENQGHIQTFNEVRKNLEKMGASQISDFEKYLKQFQGNIRDYYWGKCTDENKIVQYIDEKFGGEKWYICKNSNWYFYYGPLVVEDAPVDTTGRYGTFTDKRDGNSYRTVILNKDNGETATWMIDPLNYNTQNKNYTITEAYNVSSIEDINPDLWDENQVNQGVCPEGWHIPSRSDIEDVFKDSQEQRVRYNKELIFAPFYEVQDNTYPSTSTGLTTIVSTPYQIGTPIGYIDVGNVDYEIPVDFIDEEDFTTAENIHCVKD